MSEGLFNLLGKIHRFLDKQEWLSKPFYHLLELVVPKHTKEVMDWHDEIDLVMMEQAPIRAKMLLYWIAFVLAVVIIWSYFAEVDEVTRGEGRVIPSRQVQVIQSLDGGIVSEILVHTGQTVMTGTPLIKIDETRAVSSFRDNRVQYLSLLAKQSRLSALAENRPFEPPTEVKTDSPEVFQQELSLYRSSLDELNSQIGIAHEQVNQRERELQEMRSKAEQANRTYELTSRELAVTKPLESSGAVSEVDLLKLERETAKAKGDRDQALAQIGRVQSSIAEANRKIQEVTQAFMSKVRADLNETTAKLNSLNESSVALSDRVKQSVLKSPVNGTVSRMYFNTVGGVIAPGKEVMEVVPTDDALILETKIQPKDIAFIRLLQPATVKLTAYDYTIYGALDAIVENIAADSVIDEKGNAYYVIRVRTLHPTLGKGLPIIPGMVAQVDIMTGKKTVLSYLLKPVLKAKSYAFTER